MMRHGSWISHRDTESQRIKEIDRVSLSLRASVANHFQPIAKTVIAN
jgi:hypothetical protein